MKSKLKNVKLKVVVGVVAGGIILSGVGFVFANTDAGIALKQWYDRMFQQTVGNIEEDVQAYGDSKTSDLLDEYERLKNDASLDIDLSRETATGQSLEEIVNAKLNHLNSLDQSKQEILAEIGLQFYNVFLDGTFQIQRKAEEGLDYARNDLTTYTNKLGEQAVNQLTVDLTMAKDEAVADLEGAIRQAQDELAAALEEQEEITTRNLKNQVDWAIEDLRKNVAGLLDQLVKDQQDIIVATAQQLEDDAKAALDDVVSGINN